MPTPREHDIQRAYIIWAKGERHKDGTWKVEPALLPGVVCWSVPNGGKRDAWEAKRLKEEGVEPGIPDVHHLWGPLLCIEFKRAEERGKRNGGLSDAQVALHPRLMAAGAKVAVAYSLQEAKDQARAWGLTIPGA